MAKLHKLFLVITVLLTTGFYNYPSAFGWETITQTHELFAVGRWTTALVAGTAAETEKHMKLYTVNPVTGEVTMIGDTGLNNCTGIDFDSAGKLKALCETRDEEILSTKGGLVAGVAVVAELDTETGAARWTVPHGVSNNISDIAIRADDALFSYENLDADALHKHEEANGFQAMFIGSPTIEAGYHAMAFWGELDIKVAGNVDGTPSLFIVNSETGATQVVGALSFPDAFVVTGNADIASRASIELIEFVSMDSIRLAGVDLPSVNTLSGDTVQHAFAENQADFAVILGTSAKAGSETTTRYVEGASIALIDEGTRQVDYIVDLQNAEGIEFGGLALRQRPPAQVPTLSEYGMIIAAALLLVGALIFMRRRGLSVHG